jgi:hypothetical protein
MPLKIINKRLQKLADKETAETLQKFFKTGPGESESHRQKYLKGEI